MTARPTAVPPLSSPTPSPPARLRAIGWSLALVVIVFVTIVTCLLLVNNERSRILSAVRAYVAGEGLYSKGQKDAVAHLVRYARTQRREDYDRFLAALAIPLGDQQARLELDRPAPDLAVVRSGFLAAKNHADDVDNMIDLYRRFRNVGHLSRAIAIWTRGDALVNQVRDLGEELRAQIETGSPDPARIDSILVELGALNDRLTVLEDAFSSTLGEGSRWLESRLLALIYLATVLLLACGIAFSWIILRRVHQADLAVRAQSEALREAARQKDQFIAMLAHELRNPLTPISNSVHLLRRLGGPSSPAVEQAHAVIERQVEHVARLVDDLLDTSRVARGMILLRREPVDLEPLVREIVEDHRPGLEALGLKLEVLAAAEQVWVEGDSTRLSQAIGNVLHNAGKFTDAGGTVTVELVAEPRRGQAVLRVRDTGIGIDAKDLERVFEPFSQAEQGLDRGRGGLGLGLALVRGLIELHGGSATASSSGAGSGAQITLRLPMVPAPAALERPGPRPWVTPSRRVLVVEDNLDACESLRIILELDGHQVAVASTGPSGLEAARAFRPEIVICDIGLPGGMDGFALARELRRDADLGPMLLVALTGYGQVDDHRRTQEAGFDLHLVKPVEPTLLGEVLERAVNAQRASLPATSSAH